MATQANSTDEMSSLESYLGWLAVVLAAAVPLYRPWVTLASTVILVLLTSVPGAPLKGVPGKALDIVQAGPLATPLLGPALNGRARPDDQRGGTP